MTHTSHYYMIHLLFIFLNVTMLNAFADEPTKESADFFGQKDTKQYYLEGIDQEKNAPLKKKFKSWLDSAAPYQKKWGTRVNTIGIAIDEWVSDTEYFHNFKGNRLEVILPTVYSIERHSIEIQPSIRAKISLPNIQKRLHLIIDNTQNSIFGTEGNQNITPSTNQPSPFNITLQQSFFRNAYFNSSLELGGSFQGISPDPLAGFRFQYYLPSSQLHDNRLIQKFYWQRSKKEVIDNQYRHDWLLSPIFLLRFNTGATWWQQDKYWQLNQQIALYQTINPHRNFAYTLRGDWSTKTIGLHTKKYGVGFNWREKIYQNWFFASINPYLSLRHDIKVKKYYFEPRITFSIEVHFFQS